MQRHQILAAFISIVGVAGESYVLWHSLVNTYPFKMFTYPSAQFFAGVANGLAPALFVAFAVAAVLWSRRSPIATPVLFTIVFPVVFAVAVAVITVASQGSEVPAAIRNFDGYTTIQALREFASTALYLSGMALILGGVASGLVAVIRPRQVAGG
jgi:hypothetical protein